MGTDCPLYTTHLILTPFVNRSGSFDPAGPGRVLSKTQLPTTNDERRTTFDHSESVLGGGISVDQKDYYCIEIGLPDAPKGATTELFMLDTAATSSLLTPRAYERLGGGRGRASSAGG